MNENQVRSANMKKEVCFPLEKCESCHQEFNWYDLLWDLKEDREVCINCFHARESNVVDIRKLQRGQIGDLSWFDSNSNCLTGGLEK